MQLLGNQSNPNILSQINQIKDMLAGKNPDDLYRELIQNNPQFRSFVEQNKGKTIEQIAQENGINPNFLK